MSERVAMRGAVGVRAVGAGAGEVRLKTSNAHVERAAALADGVYTVAETAGPAELDASRWVRRRRA